MARASWSSSEACRAVASASRSSRPGEMPAAWEAACSGGASTPAAVGPNLAAKSARPRGVIPSSKAWSSPFCRRSGQTSVESSAPLRSLHEDALTSAVVGRSSLHASTFTGPLPGDEAHSLQPSRRCLMTSSKSSVPRRRAGVDTRLSETKSSALQRLDGEGSTPAGLGSEAMMSALHLSGADSYSLQHPRRCRITSRKSPMPRRRAGVDITASLKSELTLGRMGVSSCTSVEAARSREASAAPLSAFEPLGVFSQASQLSRRRRKTAARSSASRRMTCEVTAANVDTSSLFFALMSSSPVPAFLGPRLASSCAGAAFFPASS
mmetsp:Transcript_22086/g.51544  ORF Transcript_22086/g.51544 Transcript_22086/m.51544 type:complete len:323 (-) Transcript_22086:479-1447(-)